MILLEIKSGMKKERVKGITLRVVAQSAHTHTHLHAHTHTYVDVKNSSRVARTPSK